MFRTVVIAVGVLAQLAFPAAAGKLDNLNSGLAGVPDVPASEEAATETDFFSSLLPLTSAVMAELFPADHADIVAQVAAVPGTTQADLETAVSDNLTRIAVGYELNLLDAPDAGNTEIIDRQDDYITAVLEGEGADVCAPVIFSGSRELIPRGLYAKYAPQIDATMAAYFSTVRQALDNPVPIGDMGQAESVAVIDQMTAQGDKALMDHFGVMEVDSPENCPAVLAIIEAAHVLTGDVGLKIRAAQARGASRL